MQEQGIKALLFEDACDLEVLLHNATLTASITASTTVAFFCRQPALSLTLNTAILRSKPPLSLLPTRALRGYCRK
jgi:hypothetical protein